MQCSLEFCRSPQSFIDDTSKISYIIGLLKDRALSWANSKYSYSAILNTSSKDFVSEFEQTFGCKSTDTEITCKLWSLKQRRNSVAEFPIDFRTLTASSGWNIQVLKGAFFNALNEELKDLLV